jgi:hypothetical protein
VTHGYYAPVPPATAHPDHKLCSRGLGDDFSMDHQAVLYRRHLADGRSYGHGIYSGLSSSLYSRPRPAARAGEPPGWGPSAAPPARNGPWAACSCRPTSPGRRVESRAGGWPQTIIAHQTASITDPAAQIIQRHRWWVPNRLGTGQRVLVTACDEDPGCLSNGCLSDGRAS